MNSCDYVCASSTSSRKVVKVRHSSRSQVIGSVEIKITYKNVEYVSLILLIAMHLPFLLSVFVVAKGVRANQSPGIKHTSHTGAVHDYLDLLVPASKNAILHELMGPTVGSDVNPSPLADDLTRSLLTSIFFFCPARGHSSHRARSRTP
jgi:hypothetical protein